MHLPLLQWLTLLFLISYHSALVANPLNSMSLFQSLETSSEGKLGIYAINTANQEQVLYRANEPFPMGCTSKVVGVGAILAESMKNKALLSQRLYFTTHDLVSWSPITEKHLSTGMTISELAQAAICYSDNLAMNLLVKKLGGLVKLNEFAHRLQGFSFRQDHGWPEEAYSGGPHNVQDSATPKDMVNILQQLLFSKVLANPQRKLFVYWLKNNTTGEARIRAGIPSHWLVGDKTGTGASYGTTNDLGVIWPPHCAPIVVGIYYTNDSKNAEVRNDIIASATRLIISKLALHDECIRKNLKIKSLHPIVRD